MTVCTYVDGHFEKKVIKDFGYYPYMTDVPDVDAIVENLLSLDGLACPSFSRMLRDLEGLDLSSRILEMSYNDFLQTTYWRTVRERVLARDKNTCRDCGGFGYYIHHLSYRIHGREHQNLDSLITLCRQCHSKRHPKKKNA